MNRRPPRSTLFPTRRSSDLLRDMPLTPSGKRDDKALMERPLPTPSVQRVEDSSGRDRKSTRLNSSHVEISYAVFCLKKKIFKNLQGLQMNLLSNMSHVFKSL